MNAIFSGKDLAEALGVAYDEQAVRWTSALQRLIDRLQPDRSGHFTAILNAVEYHVEEGAADPTVVRHLADALLALAVADSLEPQVIKKMTQTLGLLYAHVETRAKQAAR